MNEYTVTARSAQITAGVLRLTKAQADARAHKLRRLEGNAFEVVQPVEFKRGETFGFAGDLPKAMAHLVESDKPRARKRGTAAAGEDAA